MLGDFNPAYSAHHLLNDSIRHIKKIFKEGIQFDWVSSDSLNFKTAFNNFYCGLWIAPDSPYKDMENVLNTITYTRQNNIQTSGHFGGFQHMV